MNKETFLSNFTSHEMEEAFPETDVKDWVILRAKAEHTLEKSNC